MSLIPRPEDGAKRCMMYCGPERCNCGAREESVLFVAAAVLGNRAPIPPGNYWLVECHPEEGKPGHPLYWMDDYDAQDRTGFSYIPQHAACFRTESEARAAWSLRGVAWISKPRVLFCEHAWEGEAA